MVKLHIRAVFLWSGWSLGEKLPLSVLWPLNLIHVGYLRPVVLWYINPDRGGGFTSTGIPGESHCLNVSAFGSSDPVVRSDVCGSTEAAGWFYTPEGGGFIQRTLPGESHYLNVFVIKKDGGFMIASSKMRHFMHYRSTHPNLCLCTLLFRSVCAFWGKY